MVPDRQETLVPKGETPKSKRITSSPEPKNSPGMNKDYHPGAPIRSSHSKAKKKK